MCVLKKVVKRAALVGFGATPQDLYLLTLELRLTPKLFCCL